ncbi:Glycosyl transferases group 1 [Williamsia deligens]|nr:Glycosyl transferases group 1 [Williamsia deligens]
MSRERAVMLAMGRNSRTTKETWRSSRNIVDYCTLESAAPSGRRFGSRVLGLGLDSARLAIKAVRAHGRQTFYLCGNPWTAVALRCLGIKSFAVIGIYALPGTRSWKLLRLAVRRNPVFTLVDIEADQWNQSGGVAHVLRYGNTFGYPPQKVERDEPLRLFVGGTSDRDPGLISTLVDEVQASETAVNLTIIDGSTTQTWQNDKSSITWCPRVSSSAFGELMSHSDLVVLPIRDSGRAAGHMVTVGALECGVRVLATDAPGMHGYIDGHHVIAIDRERPILSQARSTARRDAASSAGTRNYWQNEYSLGAFVSQIDLHLAAVASGDL